MDIICGVSEVRDGNCLAVSIAIGGVVLGFGCEGFDRCKFELRVQFLKMRLVMRGLWI